MTAEHWFLGQPFLTKSLTPSTMLCLVNEMNEKYPLYIADHLHVVAAEEPVVRRARRSVPPESESDSDYRA